eukprot:1298839-Amphidinium_carterae.6
MHITADHSRMALTKPVTKEIQDPIDGWMTTIKLAMAAKLHCAIEPRINLTIVNKAVEKPMETDKLLRDIWSDHSRCQKSGIHHPWLQWCDS